jgi:DNA polymerase theta
MIFLFNFNLIFRGFKDGTLKALFATSTLSSGVNLPARRVIIRTPKFGSGMMSCLTYRQMIGRAGRKGKDILGESILLCDGTTEKMGRQLVSAPLDPINSCLDADGHSHLKRALLEIIASGVASTKSDLESFVNSTLFCQQREINFSYFSSDDDFVTSSEPKKDINAAVPTSKDPIKSTMDFLLDYEFIRVHKDDDGSFKFVPTRLGMACLSSSLPPKDGFLLFSELQKSRQNFVLESELHAIYLVTPFSVAYQLNNVDWVCYEDILDKLPDMMKRVGEMVGVSHNYLLKMITGRDVNDWRAQQIHKR